MKKISVNDLRLGMFVEELDKPWLETSFPLQGVDIKSQKDIDDISKYSQFVYIFSKRNMKKMFTKDLEIGMYVEELDIPWLDTPYPVQGVYVASQEDINGLAKYSEYVYISTKKSSVSKSSPKNYTTHVIPPDDGSITVFHGDHFYPTNIPFETELPEAKKAHDKARSLIEQIKVDLDRDFKFNLDTAKELVNVIAGSIILNPDPMLFLNQLDTSNNAVYNHALNTAIHMVTFGRYLCLPPSELYKLGLGGLLMDIGQLSQPLDSTPNYGITEEHVLEGKKILSQIPSIPEEVILITIQHHERENGQGYPYGISSNQIVTYARMAAIVDLYETLITRGVNDRGTLTPFEALKTLWDQTRTGLNATLVQQFAHSIGLFPSGSLVELNTGEIAIVITQNRTNRLLPKIMVILDKDKQPHSSPFNIDLGANEAHIGDKKYEIVLDLKPGAYGIDPQEYYL